MRLGRPSVARPQAATAELTAEEAAISDPTSTITFEELGISAPLLRALRDMEFAAPTPIQAQAIPVALAGDDVIGQAHTGSGKTAAFGLPLAQRLDPEGPPLQALILCPTRELAVQVHGELEHLCAHVKLRCTAVYGGDSMNRQLRQLEKNPHIVVATPGRLLDHLQRRTLHLRAVKVVVLDEADRMLDMGFAPDVERILAGCPQPRQTLLFSATLPEWIKRLAARHMNNPVSVAINSLPEMSPTVRQLYLQTTWSDKLSALMRILDQPTVSMALIFVETKRSADILQTQLTRQGYRVALLHGDLSQSERNRAMAQFRASHVKYLIATNVAARGLDIDDISHVINYDVPSTPDEYLHRVGRTARAGREGVAVTLITPSEILKLRDVERHARTQILPATEDDFPLVQHAATA